MQSPNYKQQDHSSGRGGALLPARLAECPKLRAAVTAEARREWYEANHSYLVEKYGNPARRDPTSKKLVGLNEIYWAALLKLENRIVYDPVDDLFSRYSSSRGIWEQISEDAIRLEISERILEVARDYRYATGLDEFRQTGNLTPIIGQLRGLLETRNPFKDRPSIVHLANCCLRIEDCKRKILGYSPRYFSRNQSPIAYRPSAKCPRFLDELILPAVHPEDADVIQRYMGQCLLGKNITARLLVTHGQGGNGKSQVARIFRAIVGSENCYELRTKHVDSRFEQYRFIGKTLLLGADVPADFLSTAGAAELKKLSGGDALSPEAKSGNGIFELTGDLNFLITSNSRLKIHLEGDESAWRRRLLLIPWIAPKPKKEISGFADHLLETEGSGILNWALEGLETLLADVAIRASSLDWVIVRPGMLTDDPAKGGVRAVVDLAGINGGKIARADVARFVVDQLTTDTWLRRTPVLLW